MEIEKNGITLLVSDKTLERLVLERLNAPEVFIPSHELIGDPAPRIGKEWPAQGGAYAGIARGRDGGPDYHLIVGPEHDGDIDWNAAIAWAKSLQVHGYADFTLPFRKEQALCFANVPELFQERVYWSCEQRASSSGDAWSQYFSYGNQDFWNKGSKLRARAVRRLPIQ